MRVRFTAEEHALVKEAARARLISFNAFVSQIAVAGARRVLQPGTNSTAAEVVDMVLNSLNGK